MTGLEAGFASDSDGEPNGSLNANGVKAITFTIAEPRFTFHERTNRASI